MQGPFKLRVIFTIQVLFPWVSKRQNNEEKDMESNPGQLNCEATVLASMPPPKP